MIEKIIIDNFATIEHLEVDFHSSLNVITGESGAGKSVLIEAINMALGGRADISMVRTECEKALIQILARNNEDEEVIISRELLSSGKSTSKLNGRLITLNELKNYCYNLVDVHGQYDNQKILNPDSHIFMLDEYISSNISSELDKLEIAYNEYRKSKKRYDDLLNEENESKRQQNYYQFEYEYIANLSLKPGEDEDLRESIELMKNSEKIFSSINETYSSLHEAEPSVLSAIGRAVDLMKEISYLSDDLSQISTTLENSYYELEDASSTLLSVKDSLYYSEDELNAAQERLSQIEDAIRKYNMKVPEIINYKEDLEKKLNKLTDFEYIKDEYYKDLQSKEEELETSAQAVSKIRKEYGKKLEKEISSELRDLNFANSEFKINFKRNDLIGSLGFDDVEFLISTNPGEPLMPLSKIASGGEISRIMLSFKHVIGDKYKVPTMIFDEIDTGIGGKSALVVGKKLKEIADHHQVICITHLPQIAAYSKHSYRISKEVMKDRTYTTIEELHGDDILKNIAAMISGNDESESGLRMARDLIASIS